MEWVALRTIGSFEALINTKCPLAHLRHAANRERGCFRLQIREQNKKCKKTQTMNKKNRFPFL